MEKLLIKYYIKKLNKLLNMMKHKTITQDFDYVTYLYARILKLIFNMYFNQIFDEIDVDYLTGSLKCIYHISNFSNDLSNLDDYFTDFKTYIKLWG